MTFPIMFGNASQESIDIQNERLGSNGEQEFE
jgi:hypothetical protein